MRMIFRYLVLAFLLLWVLASCKKQDRLYKQFIVPGGVTYVGKASDAVAYSGRERVKIWWLRGSDPNVTQARIFWNNFADSVEVNIPATGDTVSVSVENLPEGPYSFIIKTYDDKGNTSVPVEVLGTTYGDLYRSGLVNRPVLSSALDLDGHLNIQWDAPSVGAYMTEVNYTDTAGKAQTQTFPVSESVSVLKDYKTGTPYEYRTAYLPDSTSLDTFYTDYLKIPDTLVSFPELDKSKFTAFLLPTDAGSAFGWLLPYLWDGSLAEGHGYHSLQIPFPLHFTMDLGVTVTLKSIRLWQRQLFIYDYGNVRKFQIWGSNHPASDGSFTGWSKLLDGESIKPSGLPLGSLTQEDHDYANAGEVFKFPNGTPPVRYIRFVVLENWSGGSYAGAHIMEVSFRGLIKE